MDRANWLGRLRSYAKRLENTGKIPEGPVLDKALERLRAEYAELQAVAPCPYPKAQIDPVDDTLIGIALELNECSASDDDIHDWSVWLDAGAVGEPPPTSKPRLRELAERLAYHRRDDGKAIDDEWLPAASPTELAECFGVTITTLKRWDGAKLRIDKVTAKRWRVNAADAERLGYKPKARRVNAADAEPIK